MIPELLRKLGIVKATLLIMGTSVVSSVSLYLLLCMVSGEVLVRGIIISIIIPAIIATILSYHFIRVSLKHYLSEKELRQSEQRFRELAELLPATIFEMDAKGNLTFVNRNAFHHFGHTQQDFDRGLNAFDMLVPEDRNRAMENVERILRGEDPGLTEYKALRKDGTIFPAMFRSTVIMDNGKPIGLRGFIIDITERKKAEEALRQGEEEYRKLYDESKRAEEVYSSILHTSADAMIIYDMEGKVKYISPAFTQIFGWTLEDVEGKRIPFLPDSEREATMAGIKEIIGNGKAIQGFETKRYTKDGRIIDVNISGSRYNNHEGKPAGMLVILRDTTEKKTLEAQLQRAQKMEAIGTLAGGVAHDLNNILSGIVSYPDLLLMQLPENSPLRRPILTVQESGNKAAAIVQDLLTMARRGVAITEVVNLNDIISKYLKSPEYEKLKSFHPDVEVKIDFAEDLLNISGSTVHLTKTIMNLVANAAEALPDGGKILITTENRYIDRLLRGYEKVDEGDYVIVTVADTGVGISSEDIEMIFEPFYTKKKMGRSGTGLGMTVVWGTVKDHNGYIDIQSTEGKGTMFTLYFPATRQHSEEDRPGIPIEKYKGKGESILVVDDVGVQRDIATGMLSELGYSVTAVSSGEEAVEHLKEHTVDLMVLDMIMDPGIDGLETYKRIVELYPKQKAIIASGFSETDRVKEAQKLGAGQYIKKPYAMGKIGIAVRAELDQVGF
jgi:two-component system cell cycle sensor histidine kinase/response regulator CckA